VRALAGLAVAFHAMRHRPPVSVTVVDPFEQELEAFAASPWGQATLNQGDASGLCKRATLALLAQLQATALANDVELWNLTRAIACKRQ
jgi:hypothetical protein